MNYKLLFGNSDKQLLSPSKEVASPKKANDVLPLPVVLPISSE